MNYITQLTADQKPLMVSSLLEYIYGEAKN